MFPGVEYAVLPATPAKQDFRRWTSAGGRRGKLASKLAAGCDGRRAQSSEGKSRQQVKSIPLGQHVVRIEKRDLKEWPAELLSRTGLKTLVLSRNLLGSVVAQVGQLRNLRRLELSFNRITAVSPEIGKLAHLETILLDHNRLENVPIELGLLVQLKVLNLDGNPLSGKACSTAAETFRDIWTTKQHTDGKGVAERTRKVLHYLQDHMTTDQHSELGDRLRRWRKREARQALNQAVAVADMGRLQKAANNAEAAGLGLEDTATARQALSILHAMLTCTAKEDVEGIMAAIGAWEKVSGLGEGSCRVPGKGADLDRALETLHEIKRKTLAMAWRKRSSSLGKSRPDDSSTISAAGRLKPMSSLTGVHMAPRADTPYEKTRQPRKAGNDCASIPFEQWLQNKKSAEKRKEEELKKFARKQRLESINKQAQEEATREVFYQMEASWPSQLEAGAFPIALPEQEQEGKEANPMTLTPRKSEGPEPSRPVPGLNQTMYFETSGSGTAAPHVPRSCFGDADLFRDGHCLSTIEEGGEFEMTRSLDLAVRTDSNSLIPPSNESAAPLVAEPGRGRPHSPCLSDIESPHMSECSSPCVSPRLPALGFGFSHSPVPSPRAVHAM